MLALTVHQPQATLVALLEKMLETRSWGTKYRGELALHAGKAWTPDHRLTCREEPFRTTLARHGYHVERPGRGAGTNLPRGAILALVTLDDCWQMGADVREFVAGHLIPLGKAAPNELAFGVYERGRYAWQLQNVRPLWEPVRCRGHERLWQVPPEVASEVRRRIARVPA